MSAINIDTTVKDKNLLYCDKFVAEQCYSCTLLETPYNKQLAVKQQKVNTLLKDFFTAPNSKWLSPVASKIAGFRTRVKFVVTGSARKIVLGINNNGQAVDLTTCPIQDERINQAAVLLTEFLNLTNLAPYHVAKRAGELKFVHITVSPDSEFMVRFVVRSLGAAKRIAALSAQLRKVLQAAVLVSVNILPEHKAVLEGEQEFVLWGSSLTYSLPGVQLNILPQSFLQTNTQVAAELYERAALWVQKMQQPKIWDLYCGVGGFALHLAATGCEVVGVEISELAVRAARKSARQAGHKKIKFIAADATEFALTSQKYQQPDLLVVNPPRRGLGNALNEWIATSNIEWLIYSSCNPQSLAADLAQIGCFEILEGQIFDMFAHTNHLEVAVLCRRKTA